MKQPLIGVDGRAIYQANRRGTGKNLIDLYRHLALRRPGWRFLVFHQVDGVDDPFEDLPNVTHRKIDIPGDKWNLWQEVRLPWAARLAGVDVLHCPANTSPRWPMVPMVVTIHDLIPLEPEFATPASEKWGKSVARAARKARRIITPSGFSKAEIVQSFGAKTDKVIVNPWAPDTGCRRVTDPAELARIREKYGVRGGVEVVLGFGAADPRKNTERILLAWKDLPAELRRRCVLLLVGIQEQARRTFLERVRELGLTESVILQGFADEADLPAILSGAAVLCYPSLSEGFGLPILDAFVCETAVVTSTTTSLPEVAGEAAVLVEPRQTSAIAGGLVKLLENQELREKMVRCGRERLKQFTWEACAERAAGVFEEVIKFGM
jgi:glycosyltransferase involved in cell wall biosynthesis